jgi:UPF0716 family protein affecting phage T7 exclusion
METGRIILTAILAGIYSQVLDNLEKTQQLNGMLSTLLLVIFTALTGYFLFKIQSRTDKPSQI